MLSIAEIREQYPDTKDLSDSEILFRVSKLTELPVEQVAQDFGIKDPRKAPKGTLGGVNDFMINTANAAVGGLKAGIDFVSPGSDISKSLQGFIESGEQKLSLQERLSQQRLAEGLESSDLGTQGRAVLDRVIDAPLQTAGQAIGSFFVPGTTIKGVRGVAGALGVGERAVQKATQFGPINRQIAEEVTSKALSPYGTAAAMGTGAILAGGDAAGEAYDRVLAATGDRELATQAARQASLAPALVGAATSLFGADKALARGGSRSILRTTGGEFVGEAIDEAVTKGSANVATAQYVPDTDIFAGVFGSGLMGGIQGAGTGAAVGLMSRQRTMLSGANEVGGPGGLQSDGSGIGKAINIDDAAVNTKTAIPPRGPITVTPGGEALLTPEQQQAYDQFGRSQVNQGGQVAPTSVQQSGQVAAANLQANQQQAADAQKQQAAQNRLLQAEAIDAFGIQVNPQLRQANFFGNLIYGVDRIGAVADALAKVLPNIPTHQQQMIKALSQANDAVGNTILKVPFNAVKVEESVNKGIEAAAKALQKFQIDAADTIEEAAGILNSLSQSAKGRQLDEINAIHEALVGQPTSGYVASQETTVKPVKKGKAVPAAQQPSAVTSIPVDQYTAPQGAGNDGQLPVQDNAGLRDVRVQGGTTGSNQEGLGLLQPQPIQSVESGSVVGGQNSVQDDAGRDAGTRASADELATGRDADTRSDERIEAQEKIRELLVATFGKRNTDIIYDVLMNDLSGPEIAERYGISQQRVDQIAGPKAQKTWGPRIEKGAKRLGMTIDQVEAIFAPFENKQSATDTSKENAIAEAQARLDAELAAKEKSEADKNLATNTEERSEDDVDDAEDVVAVESTSRTLSDEFDREEPDFDYGAGLGVGDIFDRDSEGETKNKGIRIFQVGKTGEVGAEDASANNRSYAKFKKSGAKNLKDFEVNNILAEVEDLSDSELVELLARAKQLEEIRLGKAKEKDKPKKTEAKIKAEKKAKEEEVAKTPAEQWAETVAPFDGAAWDSLSEDQQERWADLVSRGTANLAAATKIAEETSNPPETLAQKIEPIAGRRKFIKFMGGLAAGVFLPKRALSAQVRNEFEQALFSGNIEAALKTIINNSHVQYRDLANKLRGLMTDDISLKVIEVGKTYKEGIPAALSSAHGLAKIDRENGKVTIYLRGDIGVNPETFLHELTHAVLLARYDMLNIRLADNKAMSEKDAEALRLYKEVFFEFRAEIQRQFPTAADKKGMPIGLREAYSNPDEFITYALTNPEVQKWMQDHKYKGTTLWGKFKEFVKGILGIGGTSPSWLDAALRVSNEVLDAAAAKKPDFSYSKQIKKGTKTENYMFAGVEALSRSGDPDKMTDLGKAKTMETNGMSPEDIWTNTGWYRGSDGKWRFEVDDSQAKFTFPKTASEKDTLKDFIDHPELFDLYPELKDIKVQWNPTGKDDEGAVAFLPVDGKTYVVNRIIINGSSDITKASLIHEVQHIVQVIENFKGGGLPTTFDALKFSTDKSGNEAPITLDQIRNIRGLLKLPEFLADQVKFTDKYRKSVDAALQQLERAIVSNQPLPVLTIIQDKFSPEVMRGLSYIRYRLLAGEVEANNAAYRFDLGVKSRRAIYPGVTADAQRDAELFAKEFPKSLRTSLTDIGQAAEDRIAKLPKPYQGPLNTIMDTLLNAARKGLVNIAFTKDLAVMAAQKGLKSAIDYVGLMGSRQAVKTENERRVEKIVESFDKLPSNLKGTGAGSVNAFLKESTMGGKWGFQPSWLTKQVTVDPAMQAKFDALPDDAQAVIKSVFKHGHDTLMAMKKGVMDNINTEYDALIVDAQTNGDAKEVAELQKQKADSLKNYQSMMSVNENSPYAPLKRFGNYVVVGRSAEYIDAEETATSDTASPEERKAARKELEKMQTDEKHYFVQFAETNAEAKAIARENKGLYPGGVVQNFEKEQVRDSLYGGRDIQGVFYRLRNLINETQEDKKLADASNRALNRLVNDLHLSLLSEHSARQSERRRKGIAGADDDMMRAFVTQGRATAHFLSTLHNSGAIYDSLQAMRKEAGGLEEGRDVRSQYYNEMLKRHAMSLEYQVSPFVDKAMSATSTWMLLTNPAYYLQNLTQPMMMSLPVIAAKHGYTKASSEMIKAYKELTSVLTKNGLNEETYSKLPMDVRSAIESLVNSGHIDISLSQDLGRWRSSGDQNAAAKALDKIRSISEDVEAINRVVTAVAAYRLDKASGASEAQATKYAGKVVYDTHGDYSGFNAPRFSRQGIGRLATQFRKFQLIQISLIAKLGNQAFKGATAEERAIGKKALAYTLTHTFAVSGVMGLPGFTAIAWVLGTVFGDSDEPDNPEATLRKMIGDDALADLLLKGVPKLAGVDLSGKLGMGQMLSVLPYTNVDLSRDGYARAVTAAMGPFIGGIMPKVVDGVAQMSDGNYYKGVETIAPSGISQAMKGFRMGTEGITKRNGEVILSPDDITFFDAFMQGIGLPTNTITDRQFINRTQTEYEQFYSDRSSDIKRDYINAYKKGDSEAMEQARIKWMEMQDSRQANGFKRQPLSDLFRAPVNAAKREVKTVRSLDTSGSLAAGFQVR